MTTSAPSVNGTLAMLKNVAACYALVEKLRTRPAHMDGFGVFYGPSGYGKTYASIYAQNKTRALRVELDDSWTKRSLLRAILLEAGATPRGTVADLTEQVIMVLGDDPERPLIIDEADKLADKGMIELVRGIEQKSRASILLVGEELLPEKLRRSERAHNRVIGWVPANACDLADTRALAGLYVPELDLADDLVEEVRKQTEGRARRIVVTLEAIREFARNTGTKALDRATYQGAYFTSTPPRRGR